MPTVDYASAIREGFEHLLAKHEEVFVIGQGVWSPWYVGNTMLELERRFGTDRILDTPVSEAATTGAAIGAALRGFRPVVVHPRVDFALLAVDQMVNQAAKWSSMFGGRVRVPATFRCIVNRGGEQGAQHSQSLYSWFAHIPGLRVVTPATAADARDLLVASVLSDDPVVYIDDRWLYNETSDIGAVAELDLASIRPERRHEGDDVTLVASSYSVRLCLDAAATLVEEGIGADVVDLRVLNPLDTDLVVESVARTGRLVAVDGDWAPCGVAGEVIARVAEQLDPSRWRARPTRVTLPLAPAPTSKPLEDIYYPSAEQVAASARALVTGVA